MDRLLGKRGTKLKWFGEPPWPEEGDRTGSGFGAIGRVPIEALR